MMKTLQISSVFLLFSLFGCVSTPDIITDEEIDARVKADIGELYAGAIPSGRTITLAEAIARAVKYNLDNRLKLMQSVTAQKNLRLKDYGMLPQLAIEAGYARRNNRQGSTSLNLDNQILGENTTTSQDKGIFDAGLNASWDTLSFGIAYINSKQAADEAMIAIEQQRKMSQQIVEEVRYAYWRMLGTFELQKSLLPLIREIDQGLRDSHAARLAKLKPLDECLEYERAMLDIKRQMYSIQAVITEAKSELTALLGLPPGSEFSIESNSSELSPYKIPKKYNVGDLQLMALRNRPELIEEQYRSRIALNDIKKARLKYFPGLNLFTGVSHSDNSFLLHNLWASVGYRLTWNLLNLFTVSHEVDVARSRQEVVELKRLALSMAILTQVEISQSRVEQTKQMFSIAKRMMSVDDRLHQLYVDRMDAEQMDHLSLVQAKARRMISYLRYVIAYADWQDSVGKMYTSVGYQPAVLLNYNASLDTLTKQIEEYLRMPALSLESGLDAPQSAGKMLINNQQKNTDYSEI